MRQLKPLAWFSGSNVSFRRYGLLQLGRNPKMAVELAKVMGIVGMQNSSYGTNGYWDDGAAGENLSVVVS
jgi:hypothetical protein